MLLALVYYIIVIMFLNRCTGQGIRKGRINARPDIYPCNRCGRRLATREAYQVHIRKCDGTATPNRGRKPADNTCVVSAAVDIRQQLVQYNVQGSLQVGKAAIMCMSYLLLVIAKYCVNKSKCSTVY